MITIDKLQTLAQSLQGDFYYDTTMRTLYATDASAYREMPLAVAIPKSEADIKKLILFAKENKTSLIPRTAGTSLAGQVVGNGIVVDVSKHFTKILEINTEEKWVRVQPGVIRDELNMFLKNYGLFFGPETSTANRAMIGGMVGNNSCGSNSVVYGSTREHLLEVRGFLSDGSEVVFSNLPHPLPLPKGEGNTNQAREEQTPSQKGRAGVGLEQHIYQKIYEILSNPENQAEIRNEFPKPSIERRNTGYALDVLLDSEPFTKNGVPFNLCKLIAGSEGTLMFITEIKLNVVPLPPKEKGLLCVHFNSLDESLRANLIAMKYKPSASELIDHYVLECVENNIEQKQNSFFVQGKPKAILAVEISKDTQEEVIRIAQQIENEMKAKGFGYHFPLVLGEDIKKVWNLRKAGLGLLSNMVGDAKPVAVIEDTAVDVNDLPKYIAEFNQILKKYDLYCVHYAHAGSGELHLRPIINLKTEEGNRLFKTIADEIAHLVKKYKGSLSGEHGDGRLRGEYIKLMIGEKNYELCREIKRAFDPDNIFNPNKIVDTPPMNTSLRYQPNQETPDFKTVLDFSSTLGILRAAEQCNGSGDCRKTELTGGTMCPSYMATRNEKDTTRARANILREALSGKFDLKPVRSLRPGRSEDRSELQARFNSQEVKEVMDLCLSCKGCKSECPSNVDVGKLKAEFTHQYYQINGVPFRTQLIGNFTKLTSLAALFPSIYNFVVSNSFTSSLFKSFTGFAPKRSIPLLEKETLKSWYKKSYKLGVRSYELKNKTQNSKKVYLFCDEFTNYNDVSMGKKAIQLLVKLGYEVEIPLHLESGRTYLSKGLLNEAKNIAIRNVDLLKNLVSAETPLIGLEPSAILTFRDEYLDLVHDYQKEDAKKLAKNALLIDEFLAKEIDKGNIRKEQFTEEKKLIKLHGHCHQKSLASLTPTKKVLSLPANYTVHLIPSGCCGMAGSFGYEAEHYEISMKIGELVLFPTIRQQPEDVIIAANGTSCRHQIKDGTDRKAQHLVEILWEAVK
ncbi:FAD-binding and (Fe-S)-binding domain-containing protein [Thermoflexibacter ruber]|uniref:FAD/FMN-containing dehydrogenase n=1 Tax=Thermoflexibacter ruber TaxID=1003 RepID=A0A1I2DJR1_9BACT|nr:FAD-binding and (Fe-S)-binding domain-containing protein [Thermoflexibacter ruber]SFE80689.1 FAD/FMN-containing dehydrogenase [Thermoflexibacter ruber]